MTIPNLFIVGAPKCGTTALHTYLAQHPEIFMGADKENNHFATDLLHPGDPFLADERYFGMFADVRGEKVVGESSVYYLLSTAAAENIHRHNPAAKIIVMLRDPVEMLQSFHAQLVYNRDEDLTIFEEALEAEAGRKQGTVKIREGLRFNERLFYSEVVAYATQLRRYLAVFPREQVLVILYDDFKADTAGVYREVLRFLGVDPDFRPEFPIVNPRKVITPSAGAAGTATAWSRLLAVVRGKPPSPTAKEASPPQYPRMKPATRRQLARQYRPRIEELARLLGRDLSRWCRD